MPLRYWDCPGTCLIGRPRLPGFSSRSGSCCDSSVTVPVPFCPARPVCHLDRVDYGRAGAHHRSMSRARAFILLAALTGFGAAGVAFAATPIPTKAQGAGSEATDGRRGDARQAVHGEVRRPRARHLVRPAAALPLPQAGRLQRRSLYPAAVRRRQRRHGRQAGRRRPPVARQRRRVRGGLRLPSGTKYYAIQPGASVRFTRVDPAKSGIWHGKLSVKKQQDEGHTFVYDGTFAARWCGKD